jgi:hypothetical protein
MKKRKVIVIDLMQKNYSYYLTEPMGKNFHAEFPPGVTPKQMLEMGVFGGKYLTDCRDEFPGGWYTNEKNLSSHKLKRGRDDRTPPCRDIGLEL